MTTDEQRAADVLRGILEQVDAGQLEASRRTRDYLAGAAAALGEVTDERRTHAAGQDDDRNA